MIDLSTVQSEVQLWKVIDVASFGVALDESTAPLCWALTRRWRRMKHSEVAAPKIWGRFWLVKGRPGDA